jgi:hypothetical protein
VPPPGLPRSVLPTTKITAENSALGTVPGPALRQRGSSSGTQIHWNLVRLAGSGYGIWARKARFSEKRALRQPGFHNCRKNHEGIIGRRWR